MEVNGKYGKAEIYSVKVEHEAISQVLKFRSTISYLTP